MGQEGARKGRTGVGQTRGQVNMTGRLKNTCGKYQTGRKTSLDEGKKKVEKKSRRRTNYIRHLLKKSGRLKNGKKSKKKKSVKLIEIYL